MTILTLQFHILIRHVLVYMVVFYFMLNIIQIKHTQAKHHTHFLVGCIVCIVGFWLSSWSSHSRCRNRRIEGEKEESSAQSRGEFFQVISDALHLFCFLF